MTQEQTVPRRDSPFVPIDRIVSLCKRRGFVYPNSEIYGGISGIYDFRPLGVKLRNNIRRFWGWSMVQTNDNVVGIDGAIITHPRGDSTLANLGSITGDFNERIKEHFGRIDRSPGCQQSWRRTAARASTKVGSALEYQAVCRVGR